MQALRAEYDATPDSVVVELYQPVPVQRVRDVQASAYLKKADPRRTRNRVRSERPENQAVRRPLA